MKTALTGMMLACGIAVLWTGLGQAGVVCEDGICVDRGFFWDLERERREVEAAERDRARDLRERQREQREQDREYREVMERLLRTMRDPYCRKDPKPEWCRGE